MEQEGKKEKKPLKVRLPNQEKVRGRATPTRMRAFLRILLLFTLIAAVVFILAKFVFGVGKQTTAIVSCGVYSDTHSGNALIIRNETVYDDESVQSIDYVAEEGSYISRGSVICYVYSTNYTSKEASTLQNYRDTIRDYENTLLSKQTSYDAQMTHLETELLELAVQTRQLVQGSRGDLLAQEKKLSSAINDRQDYFKSQYANDLTLTRDFDNETTQQQKIDSWIQSKTALKDGIVSFYIDGFENILTTDLYLNYTPDEVQRMLNGELINSTAASRGKVNLYRIVQPGNFPVLLLMSDTNFEPQEGIVYKLKLDQLNGAVYDSTLISCTRSGGKLLLRLKTMGNVEDALYIRNSAASIGEYTDCLIVPQNALYKKDGVQGVVKLENEVQWFIPVKLLCKKEGNAYVLPIQDGVLTEGSVVRLY